MQKSFKSFWPKLREEGKHAGLSETRSTGQK